MLRALRADESGHSCAIYIVYVVYAAERATQKPINAAVLGFVQEVVILLPSAVDSSHARRGFPRGEGDVTCSRVLYAGSGTSENKNTLT